MVLKSSYTVLLAPSPPRLTQRTMFLRYLRCLSARALPMPALFGNTRVHSSQTRVPCLCEMERMADSVSSVHILKGWPDWERAYTDTIRVHIATPKHGLAVPGLCISGSPGAI